MNHNKTENYSKADEFNLINLLKIIWVGKKTIFLSIAICFIIGVFIVIITPKQYRSSSIFIPQSAESSRGGMGNLGGLASLAGINFGNMNNISSDIPPTLYPQIISSTKFNTALINAEITYSKNNSKMTYAQFYDEYYQPSFLSIIGKYTIGLPGLILSSFRSDNVQDSNEEIPSEFKKLSPEELSHFNRLRQQINVLSNEKEGTVELSFTMPEPLMAAEMAYFAENLLHQEIIDYKIKNANEQLKFTQERFDEKKEEFDNIQRRLGSFRDRNQNLSSALVLNQLQNLEAEYNFAFNMYTDLAKQLEQSKIQVSKDTPVFSILHQPIIPSYPSSPNTSVILLIFTFLGILLGFTIVIANKIIGLIKNEW